MSIDQRPSSIQIRIKTGSRIHHVYDYHCGVRDHLPFKQGLRPVKRRSSALLMRARDHLPFKQGLRRELINVLTSRKQARDHLPLKQGLRHTFNIFTSLLIIGQRPSSIKTRIKTIRLFLLRPLCGCQRPSSIKTRIKTQSMGAYRLRQMCQKPSSIKTRIM